ncbi:hypothetical protein C7964_103809 [Loktanella sp. PT4BL]|jgi:hypothetical protein|uniref:hypothetical protein n=1 Tax=Loktanella sp. PT4BL TaxID=2135611 RepID=UPI000D7591FC|nr:hypothetical protein [Loktanella sp. PT4BL]PXW69289.1 hypothetical protein C7964_103809 [Loktanella sp. PT4BL]
MGRRNILNRLLKPLGFQVYKYSEKHIYNDVLKITTEYKKYLVRQIGEATRYTITEGPFKGLKLPKFGSWSDLDIASKIVGAYELELFPAIDDIIQRRPKFVLNVGASEGYYAIGMKRRLPAAQCYTYDIDERSFGILAECAQANNVEVTRLDSFDYYDPLNTVDPTCHDLGCFIFDCEGFELEILNFPKVVSQSSIFLIELHEHIKPGVTEALTDFLRESHELKIIQQIDHSFGHYPELEEYDLCQRAILLDEQRGMPMQWLYAIPLKVLI